MPTNGQFQSGEILLANDVNTLLVRGYRNRIINGAFVINQRAYTSGSNLASGSYGFDRWKSGYTNTSLTFTAGSQATTVTISSSGVIQQIIERENIPAGTYTLSWTGTATGRVYNSGATAPSYAASPVQVTLDGSANVVVEFIASGATKTLGLVQLEARSVYSPFEYRLRSEEIAMCQRYYWRTQPGLGNSSSTILDAYVGVAADQSTWIRYAVPYPVQMRTQPTFGSSGSFTNLLAGGGYAASSVGSLIQSQFSGSVYLYSSGISTGASGSLRMNNTSTYMEFSAEL